MEQEKVDNCVKPLLCEVRNDNLKIDINEFLFAHLPGKMKIDELDEMACRIYDMIIAAQELFV